ncbi:MAG: hypothetical protein HY865_22635 [Chloroflexi bacterium]|nr:hypothetical protein [Chloroflexota bacterium]
MGATNTSTHFFFEGKPRLTGKVGAGGVASTGATTIPHTFVGLDEGDAYIVTVNRTDATGTTKNAASQTETFIGKVSSTNFINCVREVEGTAQAWAADTVLEILFSATGWNKMIEGIELEHNQDGTHKSALVTTLKASGAVVNTGTSDVTIVTPKALADSDYAKTTDIEVTPTSTNTLINKRVTKRVVSAASYTIDTGTSLNCDTTDAFIVTAQAGALKFNNPSGTGTQAQPLLIRIKDDGTARALTYDTQFRAMGTALPSTTVPSKTLYMLFIYNSTDTKLDLVTAGQEA